MFDDNQGWTGREQERDAKKVSLYTINFPTADAAEDFMAKVRKGAAGDEVNIYAFAGLVEDLEVKDRNITFKVSGENDFKVGSDINELVGPMSEVKVTTQPIIEKEI